MRWKRKRANEKIEAVEHSAIISFIFLIPDLISIFAFAVFSRCSRQAEVRGHQDGGSATIPRTDPLAPPSSSYLNASVYISRQHCSYLFVEEATYYLFVSTGTEQPPSLFAILRTLD